MAKKPHWLDPWKVAKDEITGDSVMSIAPAPCRPDMTVRDRRSDVMDTPYERAPFDADAARLRSAGAVE